MANECAPARRCRATREDDVHVEWAAGVGAQRLIEGDVFFNHCGPKKFAVRSSGKWYTNPRDTFSHAVRNNFHDSFAIHTDFYLSVAGVSK
jgi:hypothetical protein